MVETTSGKAHAPWRILLVEDDPDDAELIHLALIDAGLDAEFMRVESAAEMQSALDTGQIDAILSDYSIPGFGGREALEIMQGRGLDMPFIIVSGEIGESTAVALMKAGVHDYIPKSNLSRLAPAIERELRECAIRHDRRRTEQSLRESEQRYAALIQSIHGIVWEAGPLPGPYTFVSPQAEQLLGYAPEYWTDDANFWAENIHSEDRAWVVAQYQARIKRGKPFQLEYRRTTADGDIRWLRDIVSLATGEPGTKSGADTRTAPGDRAQGDPHPPTDDPILRGVTFDVTERRAAQDERERLLTITEQRARELSTIVAIGAALRTATGRQDTLEIVLARLQELLPLPALAYLPVKDGQIAAAERTLGDWPPDLLAALARDSRLPQILDSALEVVVLPHPSGTIHPVPGQLVGLPLRAQGRLLGLLVGHYHAEDPRLPAATRADRPLTTSERRLFTALADIIGGAVYRAGLYEEHTIMARQMDEMTTATPQGLVLLDARGNIILANPAGQRAIARLAPHQPQGPITQLGQRVLHLTAPATSSVDPGSSEVRFEATSEPPDARTFEIHLRSVDTEFATQSWLLTLADVTEERLEQRRIQEQGRLAAVGQLAAGIAHDFNNSLGVIRLYTELVQRNADLSERDRTRLQTVSQQIGHATHLIHQILDFSRRSIIQRRTMDLHQEIADTLTVLEHTLGKNIELTYEFDSPPLLVEADKTRLQQAIINLAVNARDAMPNGGRLHFELRRVSVTLLGEGPLAELTPGRWIALSLTDSGHGIEPQHMEQLFEPFFTTKPAGHGTGLGLAQVYGIVKQHNGHIDVTTAVGEGTRFTLYFPSEKHMESPEAATEPFVAKPSRHHILVIEDDPAGREALRDTLVEYGYQVSTAENGQDALTRIEAQTENYDLIVSDLVMPKMSGIQLFDELRRRNVEIPTIVITGYPLADGGQELLEAGIVDWLTKPFDAEALLQRIGRVLTGEVQTE